VRGATSRAPQEGWGTKQIVTTNDGKSECPHCKSANTVRVGQTVGKWMHFCFSCGKRFELKLGSEREAAN
jgi:transposase-like protein